MSSSTCFLKGMTCLWALIELSTIWSSSSFSVISLTQRPPRAIFYLFSPRPELEFLRSPELVNFCQGYFHLLLFFCRLSDLIDVFGQIEDLGLREIFYDEYLLLVEGDAVGCLLIEGFPMPILDGIFLENSGDGEETFQVLN